MQRTVITDTDLPGSGAAARASRPGRAWPLLAAVATVAALAGVTIGAVLIPRGGADEADLQAQLDAATANVAGLRRDNARARNQLKAARANADRAYQRGLTAGRRSP